ncbi:MAG: rhodanese-like domain-containing protein [Gammaproteobacteria bacterium]|nr:rhodanese-like domain-containing protein [Gammaproteobacteria bacterium]
MLLIQLRNLILCLCVCYAGLSFANEKPNAPNDIPGAVSVTAEEVIKLVFSNPDLVVIDSRKNTEYLKGHIEGSVNILNTELTADELEKYLKDKTTAVLFYCNGVRCMRSSDSVRKALDWGYSNVFWFRGGWDEWTDKRFPVITGK